ncbi:protein of unknown function [Candidatus Nitrosacidococcus tergens]|uniref:Uncharacterized protein n=1 Tax=Candidatus Nitrosacidococcus tergens TaxID=553981 RepID=A0A7G1Q8Z7_9GAMM|nr:protein of unknown function [Candidatus Nitrosacidococcus tergens]
MHECFIEKIPKDKFFTTRLLLNRNTTFRPVRKDCICRSSLSNGFYSATRW